ncbi:hypothetical protein BJ684DRAFT_16680 [Piptocephalis cylindrospora]|uniref:RanBD1 domain-containing protein n=1 Tax=Piptocephalis cylindrospora TaxID=1907219 RepID=A0A4P9Y426_9FUNG|nr:hypothetical protein BJ684DRAFT_16680 [Piptocephalis cylindrospora]|eukprot:RKP12881.1 hypothetical protein BJ684DRAFT_16680 [Piptocephalis cylindrospora]
MSQFQKTMEAMDSETPQASRWNFEMEVDAGEREDLRLKRRLDDYYDKQRELNTLVLEHIQDSMKQSEQCNFSHLHDEYQSRLEDLRSEYADALSWMEMVRKMKALVSSNRASLTSSISSDSSSFSMQPFSSSIGARKEGGSLGSAQSLTTPGLVPSTKKVVGSSVSSGFSASPFLKAATGKSSSMANMVGSTTEAASPFSSLSQAFTPAGSPFPSSGMRSSSSVTSSSSFSSFGSNASSSSAPVTITLDDDDDENEDEDTEEQIEEIEDEDEDEDDTGISLGPILSPPSPKKESSELAISGSKKEQSRPNPFSFLMDHPPSSSSSPSLSSTTSLNSGPSTPSSKPPTSNDNASAISLAPTSTPFTAFGLSMQSAPSLFLSSSTSSLVSSSPSASSSASVADNKQDEPSDAVQDEQTTNEAIMSGEGEEGEKTLLQMRTKLFTKTKEGWETLGVGIFKVKEEMEGDQGKRRMLCRTDGGKVILNSRFASGVTIMHTPGQKDIRTLAQVGSDGSLTMILIRVKSLSEAEELAGTLKESSSSA